MSSTPSSRPTLRSPWPSPTASNCWDPLLRFLDVGPSVSATTPRVGPANITVGRRNGTFAGSDEGGAAAIYTLIETAKLDDVDRLGSLADVLARLQDRPARRIDELLGWN
jgi:transposase